MSKAVGNAVTRNRVKRRLRELAAATVSAYPQGLYIAVRAFPHPLERTGKNYAQTIEVP